MPEDLTGANIQQLGTLEAPLEKNKIVFDDEISSFMSKHPAIELSNNC